MADNAVFLFLQAIVPLCTVYQQHCRERNQQGNHWVLELKSAELILEMILNYIIPLFFCLPFRHTQTHSCDKARVSDSYEF